MCARSESGWLVDSSEAEAGGPEENLGVGEWASTVPLSRTACRHCAANPVNLSSSLKLDLALSAAMPSRACYTITLYSGRVHIAIATASRRAGC